MAGPTHITHSRYRGQLPNYLVRLYLHQYERIPFKVEFELTVFEVSSLRWAQCGLLIQLFNLRLSWVERFAYRGILWQDIAMFVIHLLYRYLCISGHI